MTVAKTVTTVSVKMRPVSVRASETTAAFYDARSSRPHASCSNTAIHTDCTLRRFDRICLQAVPAVRSNIIAGVGRRER